MEPLIWMGVYGLELAFFQYKQSWKYRKLITWVLIALVMASSILVHNLGLSHFIYVFILLTFFRTMNLVRVLKARMHLNYLQSATGRTSMMIAIMLSILIIFKSTVSYVYLLQYVQLIVAIFILVITFKNINKLKFNNPDVYLVDSELPTVTIAIPARNETKDLEDCLTAIQVINYPKLEVLVYDDCSQDNTPEIIKRYAHSGIRFIKGEKPRDRWLAKNQAYEALAQSANGEFILFIGVDVRLGVRAIRSMIDLIKHKNKSMLSVLPIRDRSTPSSAFIQPMRYWWELALPRRFFNRPPVLSTCWMINRKKLIDLGGFASASYNILPEGIFAKKLVESDQYTFVRSSNDLEVRTVKSLHAQKQTAIRTLYPKIKKRPENVAIITIINALFLLGPFAVLLKSIFWSGDILMPLVSCLALITTHLLIVYASDPANSMVALISFPFAVIIESVIGYLSMIQYEFFTVSWKDRNICIPVMHVIPRLPSL